MLVGVDFYFIHVKQNALEIEQNRLGRFEYYASLFFHLYMLFFLIVLSYFIYPLICGVGLSFKFVQLVCSTKIIAISYKVSVSFLFSLVV